MPWLTTNMLAQEQGPDAHQQTWRLLRYGSRLSAARDTNVDETTLSYHTAFDSFGASSGTVSEHAYKALRRHGHPGLSRCLVTVQSSHPELGIYSSCSAPLKHCRGLSVNLVPFWTAISSAGAGILGLGPRPHRPSRPWSARLPRALTGVELQITPSGHSPAPKSGSACSVMSRNT